MTMRLLAAVAALVSGVVHLKLWFDGYRDLDVIGPAFLVNAAAGVVIAVLLVTWRHWVPLLLVVGFGASTLGAFVLTSTFGWFGVEESWSSGYVLTAAAAEIVAIVAGLLAARSEGYLHSLHELQHGVAPRGAHLH